MLKQFLLVGLGGAVGSMLRYGLSRMMLTYQISYWGFPLATFGVNILGSLLIGLLGGFLQQYVPQLSPSYHLLLITGFCGGFTTFSTFSNETFILLQNGQYLVAGSYVLLSVMLGLLAVWLGYSLSLRWG